MPVSAEASLLGSRVIFANRDDGVSQISQSDYYSRNLTRFDLLAKTRRLSGSLDENDYLRNAALHVRSWSNDEITYLREHLSRFDSRMEELGIKAALPDPLLLIKTDGWEEGGANGYTRANAIYLNRSSLSPSLLLHEIFHVISRYNETRIDRVYRALGFEQCNDIEFRDDLRITNPDAPYLRHNLPLTIEGQRFDVVMVMMAREAYSGGSFFRLVRKRLLAVEGPPEAKTVVRRDGEALLFDHRQAVDLYDRIGRNTGYNIHQEEVSADHFEMLVLGARHVPEPSLIRALHQALSVDAA